MFTLLFCSQKRICDFPFFSSKSFMLSTLGFTCVAFVAGAFAWWGPKFVILGLAAQGERKPGTDDK
jgi:hypothetical protein